MAPGASEDTEYSDVGPGIVESVAQMSRHRHRGWRRALRAVRDWLRSRYGLREIIFPEKYRGDGRPQGRAGIGDLTKRKKPSVVKQLTSTRTQCSAGLCGSLSRPACGHLKSQRFGATK